MKMRWKSVAQTGREDVDVERDWYLQASGRKEAVRDTVDSRTRSNKPWVSLEAKKLSKEQRKLGTRIEDDETYN